MPKHSLIRRPFRYTFSFSTLWIILINTAVFFLCYMSQDFFKYCYGLGALNAKLFYYDHMYWQIFTYMFLHQDISHLFFNMLGLLIFGLSLEKTIGSKEFVLFYLVCGTLSGLLSFAVYYFTGQFNVRLLGASGAIYSVLFGYAVCYPRSIIYIWGLIPVPAPLLVVIYTVIEIFSQFSGRSGNVAHLTHLFGFLAAWLYFIIRMGIHPIKLWKNEYRR